MCGLHHAVDVGVISHIRSGGQTKEKLQELHGEEALGHQQHNIGNYETGGLEDQHGLITEVVSRQQDGEQQNQVGVRPYRIDFIYNLQDNLKGLNTIIDMIHISWESWDTWLQRKKTKQGKLQTN